LTEHLTPIGTDADLRAQLAPETPPADLDAASLGLAVESLSPGRLALRRFRKTPSAMFGLILLIVITLSSVFAPLLSSHGENERLAAIAVKGKQVLAYAPPNAKAWLGTDDINRDLFTRILYGGRISLFIGIAVAITSCLIGTAVGTLAAWKGGVIDDILMRVTDIFLAFPILVSLLVIRNFFDRHNSDMPFWARWVADFMGEKTSLRFMIILLSAVGWMAVARIVRGSVLSIKEREFIEAARALGASGPRTVIRHVVPNAIGPIMVAMTLSVIGAILAETTLSFFGYGASPGAGKASWGLLVAASDGAVLTGHWWIVIFPCAVLVLTILSINFVGDGLSDAFDPKSSRVH
jgi:peptide/nickel transport system permease protein